MIKIHVLFVICVCFLISSIALSQDKIIKKEVPPTPEEQEKIKDIDPKSATYPTLSNFKKELKDLPTFRRKYIPTPVLFTDPSTGYSLGAGLGVVFYDQENSTRHVILSHAEYNQYALGGITGRYVFMPTEKERYYYKISKFARTNEEYLFEYVNKKFYFEKFSFAALADIYQDGTARFYGLGRHTSSDDRLNYNRSEQSFQLKGGYLINQFVDLQIGVEYMHVNVKKGIVKSTKQVVDVYAGQPIISNSSSFLGSLHLRFNLLGDSDEKVEFLRFEPWGALGNSHADEARDYYSWGASLNWFRQISPRWSVASYLAYQEVRGNHLPFYLLSDLGGSRSYRGYETGRFYDKNALNGMLELRWKVYHIEKFGFTTDWEIAAFYDYGQVGHAINEFEIHHLSHAVGVGLRTHLGKNFLTRFDVGWGDEGVKIFVDFGYPF